MAKRKRLNPAAESLPIAAPETKAMSRYPFGGGPVAGQRAPVAHVAGDAAAQAALTELANEMSAARAEGRMILSLPLDAVQQDHLVRDRLVLEGEDMAALIDSIRSRGQQTPVEVVDLGQGEYGLISGWRRLEALKTLYDETKDSAFSQVQCLVRPISNAGQAYLAMVEENEIRVGLSFYERAHVAVEAARLGLFKSPSSAVQALFGNSSASKRSKILSFVTVHEAFDTYLKFPAAIPEKLGLALAKSIQQEARFVVRVRDALRKTPPEDAKAERATLERALRRQTPTQKPAKSLRTVFEGLNVETRPGRVVLTGAAVDATLQEDLVAWLTKRANKT